MRCDRRLDDGDVGRLLDGDAVAQVSLPGEASGELRLTGTPAILDRADRRDRVGVSAYGIEDGGAVLVRRDGIVAWRGRTVLADRPARHRGRPRDPRVGGRVMGGRRWATLWATLWAALAHLSMGWVIPSGGG